MNNKRIDSKADVETFLSDLKEILESDTFVIERDLDILLKKKGESAYDPYSTDNTLGTVTNQFDGLIM